MRSPTPWSRPRSRGLRPRQQPAADTREADGGDRDPRARRVAARAPIASAETTGIPSVMPTCWLIVASPVASPCSSSGSPEVAITMKPTIATRFATPPTTSRPVRDDPAAARSERTSGRVAAAWTTRPATIARRAPKARSSAARACRPGPSRAEDARTPVRGQRRVAEHLLQVQREQEHERGLGRERQQPSEVAPATVRRRRTAIGTSGSPARARPRQNSGMVPAASAPSGESPTTARRASRP